MAGVFRRMPSGSATDRRMPTAGVRVSLFMDAEPAQMAAARSVGADRIELYTEPYAAAWGTPQQAVQLLALPRCRPGGVRTWAGRTPAMT